MFVTLAAHWILALLSATGPQTGTQTSAPTGTETAADVFHSLELNQAFIEARRPELRDATDRETKTGALRLREPPVGTPKPDFDDPRSVVRFLLGVIESGTVYPTEGYFYFRFDLDGRRISGNLRFTSIADGVLHTGYFETGGADHTPGMPSKPGIGAVRTGTFGAEQGLTVVTEPSDEGETTHRVSLDGESATFVVPALYRARPASLKLRDGERFVSGVLDESGYALALIFNEHDPAFRFLLHPDLEPPETLTPIDHTHQNRVQLFIGTESGFVFIRDEAAGDRETVNGTDRETSRLALVGVDRARIMANDYFDGPFDQVPPDLALRPLLHAAYPYTRTASPVDEHGNFIGRESSRVAIAPYTAYASTDELTDAIGIAAVDEETARPDTASLILVLTREYQQDFVPPFWPEPDPRRSAGRPGARDAAGHSRATRRLELIRPLRRRPRHRRASFSSCPGWARPAPRVGSRAPAGTRTPR